MVMVLVILVVLVGVVVVVVVVVVVIFVEIVWALVCGLRFGIGGLWLVVGWWLARMLWFWVLL